MKRLLVLVLLMAAAVAFAQDISTVDGLRNVIEGTWSVTAYSALYQSGSGVPWIANRRAGPGPDQIEFNDNGAAIFDDGAVRLWTVQRNGSVWAMPSVQLTGDSEVAYLIPLWISAAGNEMDALLVTSDAPINGYGEYLKLRKSR